MNIVAFVDGSGTVATGPACIGVALFVDDVGIVEVSAHVGQGTNNVAELRAIRRAMWLLEQLFSVDAPATIVSDSAYAIGAVLSDSPWPIANEALIRAMREQYKAFAALELLHVKGHSGHSGVFGNELADWLAGEARERWQAKRGLASTKKRKPRPEPPTAKDDPKPNSPADVGYPGRST